MINTKNIPINFILLVFYIIVFWFLVVGLLLSAMFLYLSISDPIKETIAFHGTSGLASWLVVVGYFFWFLYFPVKVAWNTVYYIGLGKVLFNLRESCRKGELPLIFDLNIKKGFK